MDYNLQPNEGVLLQSINVKHAGASDSCDELILTNLNIIYIDRGAFTKKVKNVIYYPLKQLKKVNGKPQILSGVNGKDGSLQLQLFFYDCQESFEFSSKAKKEIGKWIRSINSVIEGFEVENEENHAIPGVAKVAKTIRDTITTFTGVLTEKSKNKKMITSKCNGCMAQLSGIKGEVVKCNHCDNKQKL